MTTIPNIDLNDGNVIPQLGFGVWQVPDDEATPAVAEAIKAGYRLIDTAEGYDNEEGVGKAIQESGIPRDQLFITSKLRNGAHAYDKAIKAFELSAKKLGLDYLDMFLIHWPVPEQDKYVDAWRALVELKGRCQIRSIGVSNFLPDYVERIVDATGVLPVVNQIELHPKYQQRDSRTFHAEHNIALGCYSPLGSGAVLDDPVIGEIAKKTWQERIAGHSELGDGSGADRHSKVDPRGTHPSEYRRVRLFARRRGPAAHRCTERSARG